jgi:hypothetical protein
MRECCHFRIDLTDTHQGVFRPLRGVFVELEISFHINLTRIVPHLSGFNGQVVY